jgi:toxin secretion/phage lysis holin
VAGVFHNSGKSETGALESRAGWKGLCRKGMTLLIVLVAVRLDIAVGTSFIKDAVVIGYIANEALSIVENAGLMGLPIPEVVQRGIDVLRKGQKSEVIKNE